MLVRSVSPQRPEDLVAQAAAATPVEVATAAALAQNAQRDWWSAAPRDRCAALSSAAMALRVRAGEAADLVVREVGKPVIEARGEVDRAVSILEYYAQAVFAPLGQTYTPSLGSGLLFTDRLPRGIAGLITPWNFPFAIPLWKAAPALAAGNAVLLKPSPDATGCALWLADLLVDHLPGSLFTVLPGYAETGAALIGAAQVVSFTGSSAVGAQVAMAATSRGIPVQAEMGGHNAAIVLPDADPEPVANMILSAAMGFAGQKCTATRRVITVGKQPEFMNALIEAARRIPPTDPGDDKSLVGPVITAAARDRVIAAAASAGSVLIGGVAVDGPGFFVTPTIVTDVPHGHDLLTVETFGPLLVVQQATDVNHAVELADATSYGLVTSIHGQDLASVLGVARSLHSGLVKINTPTTGVDFYLPFGGEKASSIGQREQGLAALDFYAATRTITVAP